MFDDLSMINTNLCFDKKIRNRIICSIGVIFIFGLFTVLASWYSDDLVAVCLFVSFFVYTYFRAYIL